METRWVTGVSPENGGGGDPSPVTAFGVLQGMRATAHRLWGADSLAGRSVAVQGLGSVGGYLAGYLSEEGAKVIGCDIDATRAAAAAAAAGVEIVPPDEIYDVDCDIFAPCALGGVINDSTTPAPQVPTRSRAAPTISCTRSAHGTELHRRGILYAPDFVINAGGLINVFNELIGYNQDRAMRMARGIYDNVLHAYQIAERDGIPPARAGERMAEERIQSIQALGPRHWELAVRRALARPL